MKNCDRGLENAALGQARGHSFSLYGPPSRQITYIYYIYYVCYRHRFYFGTTLLILTALIFLYLLYGSISQGLNTKFTNNLKWILTAV